MAECRRGTTSGAGVVIDLGRIGVWTAQQQWPDDPEEVQVLAGGLEELGLGTIWIGNASGDLRLPEAVLEATTRVVVATGVVNVWTNPVDLVVESQHRLAERFPARFLLGLGAGHSLLVEKTGHAYQQPMAATIRYLDEIDRSSPTVAAEERILAALGPRMLGVAASRSVGAHPYLVTTGHTATAREIVGPRAILAPHQMVILSEQADEARPVAARALHLPLRLSNYVKSFRRMGFTDDDLAGGGSTVLQDGLIAWGGAEAVASRVLAHLEAGADHVAVQVLATDGTFSVPRDGAPRWREAVAAILTG